MTLTGLRIALQFLTRLPVPPAQGEGARDLASAAPWLPVVGAVVGAVVALAVWALAVMGPWVAALAGLLAWVMVTGGLHLEGLGDVADGLGAAHGNADRFVEVARDPHVGGFGVIAIALGLIAKLVLLARFAEHADYAALILVAAWARWIALALGHIVPPLTEGMASRFAAGIDQQTVVIQAVVLAALSVFVAPLLILAVLIAYGLSVYWLRRVGGMTGDCHGASIEVGECMLLFLSLFA
jgi:adenosylcobinamide-GDP ribazoletransferase